jgi:hypothetical protein
MISILTPPQIQIIERDTPQIDPRDIELDILYNSPVSAIYLPDCFKEQIFKELYGIGLDQAIFKDNNTSNWKFNNIVFLC